MSKSRVCETRTSDLSATALTEDAEGCSRLIAVIATDPGYAARAQEAQSGRATPFASIDVDGERSCSRVTPGATSPVRPGRRRAGPAVSPMSALASAVLVLALSTQAVSAVTSFVLASTLPVS